MKKIFSVILSLLLFISTISVVHADDNLHNHVFDIDINNVNVGQVSSVTEYSPNVNTANTSNGLKYVTKISIQLSANFRGGIRLILSQRGDERVLLYGCTIVYAGTGEMIVWMNSTDHAYIEIYSTVNQNALVGAANYSLSQVNISNANTLVQIYDYLTDNLIDVSGVLTDIKNNTDQLEGYVDTVESQLSSLIAAVSVQNGLSLVDMVGELIGFLSDSVSGAGDTLYDIVKGLLATLSSMADLFDSADMDNSDVIAAINGLQSMHFTVYDLEMPYYQYLFFSMLTRSNMSLVRYDESNVPYVQWGDIKDLNLTVTANGAPLILAYYVNSNANNTISIGGSFGNDIRHGINTATRYGTLQTFNSLNGSQTVSFSRIDNGNSPGDSNRIYPLFMGYGHIPEDIALLFPGVDSSSSINVTARSILSILNAISSELNSLVIDSSDQDLINAINDLEQAISQMNQDITVTNNVSVNTHDIPFYQYIFLSMLIRNDYSLVNFDESGAPYVSWGDIKNNTFTFNAGTGSNTVLISYFCTDANMTMKINNQNITRYRGFGSSSKFNSYYYGDYSFGNQTVTFSTTSNNGVISDVARIYPLYMGRYDSVPEDVGTILGIVNNGNRYVDVLNDILTSINDLNMFTSYNISTEQVNDITVDFDNNMDIVNNVEINFNNSFESSNNSISNSNLIINFEPYADSITLYHSIFRTFYNIPLFKYAIIVCMVGGVLLVLLG